MRHHRKLRSQGGSDEPANLLSVCAFCHEWIHHNVEDAHNMGWLVRSWETP